MAKQKTIHDLIREYFQAHPYQDLNHGPVVDWVEDQYFALYHQKPRDTWRAIRQLSQKGELIKVKKGIYRYDPNFVRDVTLFDFPSHIKEEIFRRDNYRCVVCGRGRAEGLEICADHIKPKDFGGDNSIDNGQTLCTMHNLQKHNYSQTESGKRFFIKLYEQAKAQNDEKVIKFCEDIFNVYEEHDINGHIKLPY
jgi:predicted restriction endonuclease